MIYANFLIAAFVACMIWFQVYTAIEKLRLDLYDRRFEIYTKTLDWYQAVLRFDRSTQGEYNVFEKSFIKVFRESLFLFDNDSGIYELLKDMQQRSCKMIAFREITEQRKAPKEAYSPTPDELISRMKEHAEFKESYDWFQASIHQLEGLLSRYLLFGSYFTGFKKRITRLCQKS